LKSLHATDQTVAANGASIPIVGFGTWTLRGRECALLVEQAIAAGYRHIDTAQMYDNESAVGKGVRASGLRDQVFVTTKVTPENLRAADLERSTHESVKKLGFEPDLLLIHWPNARIPLAETIGALNKVKREGLTRHIGVSNFTVSLIDDAVKLSDAPLVCDQVEYHPFLDQSKVIAACRRHGMAVVAYSPIARGGADRDKVLARIGKAHGKSAAQVSLRWLIQQGVVVIPRTSKPERLKENIDVFDFELSAAEMKEIGALAHRRGRIVDWSYSPEWD
jgi:diketogulonate reductase-like aldo/keto reductase